MARCFYSLGREGEHRFRGRKGADGDFSRTSSISILLRVATLNDALLLVLELLGPGHGISGAGAGAIARICCAPRIIRRRWTETLTAVHHGFFIKRGVAGFVCMIRKFKETWSGYRRKSTGSLSRARC